ncbi:MAG TPA: ammonium transporter [Mycobacteriales bacterium]|nr:amtB1 [Cryptosporangiaceae bacterium]MDQ1678833.1 ammonium transporter, Amt family [Actinomycetota bacterium]HEV7754709.1 ammonium transporter [Mycobacteriales bacterium]
MKIDSGDTAWLLASSALVLLMTPGLAFFYGGMVRVKSVLNMLMMSFGTIGLVTVLWVLYGYSFAFGGDSFHGLIGNLSHLGLADTITSTSGTLPMLVFVAFQLMFAIITPALISGAIADRAKFGAWMVFVGVWATVVYFPVAHWVFFFDGGNGGWIGDRLGALDFAGGTAVHINAGAAGLALALVLGKRHGWPKEQFKPHNLPLVLLGAGLLWFGWFGFNAGSALAANGQAAVAFVNTQVATAAALLAWLVVEKLRDGHATTLGAASGAVAGLVAITPACASVNALGAIGVGVAAGALCALAVGLKYRLGFDDSLDVVAVHLVGGIVGSLIIGFLATPTVTGILSGDGPAGLFYGGGLALLGKQTIAVVAVCSYSFLMTWLIGKAIDKTMGFRIPVEDEVTGIDTTTHAESAYDFVGGGGGSFSPSDRAIAAEASAVGAGKGQ